MQKMSEDEKLDFSQKLVNMKFAGKTLRQACKYDNAIDCIKEITTGDYSVSE